jgi:cyclic beta-1,2-glucan synthetase
MAHHQGMALLAIDNALHAHVMQARFHADPRVQAAEPLLFERMPTAPPIIEGAVRDTVPTRPTPTSTGEITTGFRSPDTPVPRAHLLANNSSYAVMVTGAGSGYSRWHDIDVSRWRPDTTLDCWGSFCYVRDLEQGVTWSTTYQPIRRQPAYYSVTFKPDHAEFERRDVGIGSVTEIVVSPEDDAEIRRLTLVNQSNRRRQLEITSYVELALASPNGDRGHPAFSKLFVQTEAVPERRALLAWRKQRSPQDPPIYATHVLVLPPSVDGEVTFETDRARFLGRGRGPENPMGVERPLSNSVGSVLDPVFCLRCRVTLEPGQRVQLAYVTGAAESGEKALAMVEKFQDLRGVERAFDLAAFQAQLELRHLRITADDVQRFLHLASHLLFPNAQLRAGEQQLRQNRLGQSRLWPHGISGDLPIMLVAVGERRDAEAVAEALVAHTFWRLRGLKSDLVILNEEPASYEQPLQDYLKTLVQAHAQYTGVDQPGGIFLRSANLIPAEDLTLLFTVARAVVVASRGPLVQQLSRPAAITLPPPLTINPRVGEEPSPPLPFLELPYFNGLGGFTGDGREYAIYLGPGTQTPAPWVNVMANPTFGALVSESGQGFTWYGNSQANRLLPWSNDPVSDPSGDALYIRDEESGRYWTPTALPIRELDAYRARHGQGYTVYEHNSHAIEQELVTFVPLDDSGGASVRVQRLRLRNRSSRRRRLSVIAYGEWVLGGNREETQLHVVSSWDAESQALLARNAYHPDYGTRVAFASASLPISSYTADRTEFLGRNGSRATPAALGRRSLAGRTGAGLDPCAALQVVVEIDPNEATEVTVVLGQAADAAQARRLVRRFRDPERVEQALRDTRRWWDTFLGTIQVETPVLGVNFLLNRWLPYQTLSCRFWARSAFYQSGGAFGFRDQLQDAMALVYAAPRVVRQHILATAARQFVEGDVQHWWHPQSGGGVRTRISDDLLWLPYVTAHYIRVTGDTSILDEVVPFLEGHMLEADEHERYFVPATALEAGTLLEHCRRAIEKGLTRGPHGLPLIGTGDWNDGLNLVGAGGTGESVWLAWFLIDVLREFAALLEVRGDVEQAGEYRARAAKLAETVEAQAWDGEWYRRAYFDDGTPLGSKENAQAMIDSLPQSWAVISGAASPDRAEQAMEAVERHLIRADDRLVLLFTPPFESAPRNPGYIQGYPPGVRENGGQYTHGAVWVALAYARRGDGDRAVKTLMLLNPIEHARVPEEVERYKVEPYVVAADVYALEGNVGRGGWTWYTGSSGWMYRVWLEEILGFKLHGDRLTIDPVLPSEWDGFRLRYRHGKTPYDIVVENSDHVNRGVAWVELDGQRLAEPTVALQDDEGQHVVRVRMGR